MNLDRGDTPMIDEYFETALQIFNCCGGESNGTLQIDSLMDQFAPFVKTNKSEYSYLRSLLDPDHNNPEITVQRLARALNQYSASQKSKDDLDESFNSKTGPMPQDSDSGISNDGFQILEELQCELREKSHLAQKLRTELDYADRQHEEALAAVVAERDAMRAHLNLLREENTTLTFARRDYEDASDRLCASEQALDAVRAELETHRRRNKVLQEQVHALETDKLTLQELLSKSKDECHRINEMYATRQSALLEENETLKTEHADLSTRYQDQEEFMQQMIKEKIVVEMELRDLLNKTNQTHPGLNNSIDLSYTEQQLLSTLDPLNADSRFSTENQILDEESFLHALREDPGRKTNVSLFDELRLSMCTSKNDENTSRYYALDTSMTSTATQTDDSESSHVSEISLKRSAIPTDASTQTCVTCNTANTQTYNEHSVVSCSVGTQCDMYKNTKCTNCAKLKNHVAKLEAALKHSHHTAGVLRQEVEKYESNLDYLQKYFDEGDERNSLLQLVINKLQSKLTVLELACAKQKDRIDSLTADTVSCECQTESDVASVGTQVSVPCLDCEKRNAVVPHRSFRRFLWEPLKCLFQVFAVICFICAVSVLYGVTRRWHARCERETAPIPWRWFDAQELMDLLLRIEYVNDIPM